MSDYIAILKQSLKKKIDVLEELAKLCDYQSELIGAENFDYERFDAYVADKDVCLENIEKLDEGFETLYQRVKDELDSNRSRYAEDIRDMQASITKITELGVSIEAKEQRNRQGIERVILEDRKKLREGKRSLSVARNYYQNMNMSGMDTSMYMDKKK